MKSIHPVFLDLSKRYRTPYQVQKYIQKFDYNSELDGLSVHSALSVVNCGKAHCLEAAFVAAAILEVHGYPPLVLDLESRDGLDHVLFLFKDKAGWGTIGRSREPGLEGRAPRFRTIKALAMSYYDPYIDDTGKIYSYQVANLDQTKANWRTSQRNVWKAENYLLDLPHKKLRVAKDRYQKIFTSYARGKRVKPESFWW